MDTEMRTKGFGVDRANNTFYHKEDQLILGEHIAQKGTLKHITIHAWTCMLQCSFCWWSCHPLFSLIHRQIWASPNLILHSDPVQGLSAQ